jgi:hypothetical protein
MPRPTLQNLPQSSERLWTCNRLKGNDVAGVSADGVRWRWISLPLGQASYRTTSEDLAVQFDLVLNSLCCDLTLLNQ